MKLRCLLQLKHLLVLIYSLLMSACFPDFYKAAFELLHVEGLHANAGEDGRLLHAEAAEVLLKACEIALVSHHSCASNGPRPTGGANPLRPPTAC